MNVAQQLATKYAKEMNKRFRVTKGAVNRLTKCAKAGQTSTVLFVSSKAVDILAQELTDMGFAVAKMGDSALNVSWVQNG